jgi:hypothetical protein
MRAPGRFSLVERGLVEMKGKGEQLTYWLSGNEGNNLVNENALKQLDREIQELLAKRTFDVVPMKKPNKIVEMSESSSGWIDQSESSFSGPISTVNLFPQSDSSSHIGCLDASVTHDVSKMQTSTIESSDVCLSNLYDFYPILQVPSSTYIKSATTLRTTSPTQKNDDDDKVNSECRCLIM